MRQQQQQQQPSQMHQQSVQIPTLLNEMDPNSLDNSMDSSSMSESSWQTPPQSSYDDSNHMVTPKGRKSHVSPGSSSDVSVQKAPRRNAGGRKPSHHTNCTPEEEAKRRVRRERNKLAAARCRKRREDHTSELQDQVDELENKKASISSEIQQLSQLRDELTELLDEHKRLTKCVVVDRSSPPDVKPAIHQNNVAISTSSNIITTTALPHIPQIMQQIRRPTSFVINQNNNNNNMMNANNNKLTLKIIKTEPEDDHYDYDEEPPRKRKCDM